MQIIISDSSCLIDLGKTVLLKALLLLPFEEELLRFSEQEKKALLDDGLKVLDLPGDNVRRAIKVQADFPALSIHDCFAFALAESIPKSILLTGDGGLRTIASNHQIEVHGVLWAIDEMHKSATATVSEIINALELFESDPTIFRLPSRDLKVFIRRYKSLVTKN